MIGADTQRIVTAPMEECWRKIGVAGDRSCPELETFIHCRNCPVLAAAARTFFDRPPPPGYLDAWQAVLEEPETVAESDAMSVLVFRLGTEWLALPTDVLVEVTPLRPLHRVPHRGGTILEGIVNIRGQLQLCASLHGLLGLGPAGRDGEDHGQATARLLVVERAGPTGMERWTLPVDDVAGVHRIVRSALRDVPSTVSHAGTRHALALFALDDRSVSLLDEQRIFDGLRAGITS
jgi:chemotaxis-related protein WspD